MTYEPKRPRIRVLRIVMAWIVSAAALLFAAWIVPGVAIGGWWSAVLAAAAVVALPACGLIESNES